MKVVFYSLILNNHQANVADELWRLTGHSYCFVELANLQAEHRKGDTHDYRDRPYYLRAWQSDADYRKAMELAVTAECCVFSGVQALPFQKKRMKLGLLSFDMSERWLKRGFLNLFSPPILKMFIAYHLGGWRKKPLYKLCCSAFAAKDQLRLGMYRDKCYKWGYFTKVGSNDIRVLSDISSSNGIKFMWCSRYLTWKHPELPIFMAKRLIDKGYKFILDMYGDGELKPKIMALVTKLKLDKVIQFYGNMPNSDLMEEMKKHDVFLFTSDRNEGWGAVANESMANGCVLIAGDSIGSIPYLVKDGYNGLIFKSSRVSCSLDNPDDTALDSLCLKVEWLLQNPTKSRSIQINAMKTMRDLWSPQNAAHSLIQLIENINCQGFMIKEGPCSKA